MKLKKKSGLIGIIAALSAASVISVGFASWVISQGDHQEITGDIQVDNVDNKIYKISTQWVTDYTGTVEATSHTVVYGHPATMSNASAWLTNVDNDGSKTEALDFYLKVTVTNAKNKAVSDVLGTPAQLTSTGGNYASAQSDGLVGTLPTPTLNTGVTSFTTTGENDGFVVYNISFKWGSYFGEANPYSFYNSKTAGAYVSGSSGPTWAEDAVTKLTNLNTYLTGATYKVTLETTNYSA